MKTIVNFPKITKNGVVQRSQIYKKVETSPKYEKEIDKFNEEVIKEFNRQSKKFYRSKEAAHKKHYKIKGGKPIEALV